MASHSSSGCRESATGSSAARETLNLASTWETSLGRTRRTASVDAWKSGIRAVARTDSATGTPTARYSGALRPSTGILVQEITPPPSTLAAALSGCPSKDAASWISVSSSSAPVGRSGVGSPASPEAATTPATAAAAEDPRPRECGMTLWQVIFRPRTVAPASRRPARTARTTRCRSSSGTSPSPSPWTMTSRPESVASTSTTSVKSTARPRVSNPGPRFAEEAGTVTLTARPTATSDISYLPSG